ncbi:hypothetical protein L9G16_01000 [Shewanella sp. A25]|nr:hypothetical protein [Shewanella shenzhenensis]
MMDTSLRHKIWEVFIKGKNYPIIASKITEPSSDGVQLHDEALLKRTIAEYTKDQETYITCSQCGCGLFYRAANPIQNRSAYLYHNTKFAPDICLTEKCPFYHSTPSTLFSEIYNGEGEWHLSTKLALGEILKNDPFVSPGTVKIEKLIFSDDPEINTWRRPDIQFTDNNSQKWAIELTRWWMSPLIIVQREQFFRNNNINLLWVFSPECSEHNKTTYELIMYGSNITREAYSEASRPQCNAFVVTERALILSKEKEKLFLDVEYPEYYFNKETHEISANFQFHLASLEELDTSPKYRLPFAVKTSESLYEAKLQLHQHNRQRLAATIVSIRNRNQTYLALTSITENDNNLINPLSDFESIHSGYRFLEHLKKQSLIAKKHLDSLHIQNIRAARFKFISQLRREVSNIQTKKNYRDIESLRYTVLNNRLDASIFEKYRYLSSVNRYQDIIRARLTALEERMQHAEEIRKTRTAIKLVLRQFIDGTLSQQTALNTLNSLKNIIESASLTNVIERTTLKIEKLIKQQEETRFRVMQEQLASEEVRLRQAEENKRRVINETSSFIDQLNASGFTEIPISNSYDEIKFRRLKDDCYQQNLHELELHLQEAYSNAYIKMRDSYLQIHFPLTSLGWNSNTDFTTELNQLFDWQRCKFKTKSVADKQCAIYQEWCSELLYFFINSVLDALDKLHKELLWAPHIDQIIQIKKYGGDYARRLTYSLKMIINNNESLISTEDKTKAKWLKNLVQEDFPIKN